MKAYIERWRRIHAIHGVLIFFLGAVVGGALFALVHPGGVVSNIEARRWSIAHQQGLAHAFLLFGIGALLGHFRLTPGLIRAVGWTLIPGAWAAVIASFVSAFFQVAGREWTPSPPLPPDELAVNRIAFVLFAAGVAGPAIALLLIVIRNAWEGIRSAIAPLSWKNWVKTVAVRPGRTYEPRDVRELIEAVQQALDDRFLPIRAFGARGSWNPLAASRGAMIDMRYLKAELDFDANSSRLTVEAGMLVDDLSNALRDRGLSLDNAPVVQWIQVGGAVAVGAHGTGVGFRHFVDHVVAMQVVQDVNGVATLQSYQQGDAEWPALVLGLGTLGVIYSVTFQASRMRRVRLLDAPAPMLDTIRSQLPSLVPANEYTEIFWFPHNEDCWVKTWNTVPISTPTEDPPWYRSLLQWFNTRVLAPVSLHLVSLLPWITPLAMKLFGSIVQLERTPRVMELPDALHYQEHYAPVVSMGYAIPYGAQDFEPVKKAWLAVTDRLELLRREGIYPLNMVLHARFVDRDEGRALLYPSTGHAFSCYIEILTFPHMARHEDFFRSVEQEWLALGGRPNWPKLHFQPERVRETYPPARLAQFLAIRETQDPDCVFLNDYARELLGL